MTTLLNRIILVNDHKTSMRLTTYEWYILDRICIRENLKREQLFELIDTKRSNNFGFTQTVRLFSLLYLPCISTVSVFAKEIGAKWTVISCLMQFAISYALAFVVYKVAIYFCFKGVSSGILSILVFVIFALICISVSKAIRRKKMCKYCSNNCLRN